MVDHDTHWNLTPPPLEPDTSPPQQVHTGNVGRTTHTGHPRIQATRAHGRPASHSHPAGGEDTPGSTRIDVVITPSALELLYSVLLPLGLDTRSTFKVLETDDDLLLLLLQVCARHEHRGGWRG